MTEIKKNSTPQSYGDESIQILEGLEAVRKRPGMYIGSTDKRGLHHLVYEIFDNAVDEALSGYGNKIVVTINSGEDGKVKGKNDYITVRDLGRGVPTGQHATGKPTAEVIFTVLHAGGKFGQGGYKSSGGLHGVGSSVVNALSSYMSVRIWRDGVEHFIEFEDGGHPVADKKGETLHKIGKSSEPTGTLVTFQPDPTMFSHLKYSFDILAERLRETAFLMKGMEIVLRDERNQDDITEETFLFHEGLGDFVGYLNNGKKTISPVKFFEGKDEETGIESDIAIQWNEEYSENILSFVNNVRTRDGGTHETGFKSAVTRALNAYAKDNGFIKGKNAKSLEGGDIREGLVGIVSVRVPEEILQFEGQTKGKLGTTEARGAVDNFLFDKMSHFFAENPSVAEDLINKAVRAQKLREDAKKLRDEARNGKKKKKKNPLVDKLAPETHPDKTKGELFIVEGDSAGGSAKQGRDRNYQAILSLRGKVLNTQDKSLSDALKNAELNTITEALEAGIGADFDADETRYSKVIIMTDADTDGAHIQCLLLTFFLKFMPKLIEAGKLYIAQPPLFRVVVKGKTSKQDTYKDFWDSVSMRKFIEENKLTKEKYTISRFKGLGEMNEDQLWETTMDPESRILIQVRMEDKVAIEKIAETLMGGDADARKKWINATVDFDLDESIDI